MNGAAYGYVTFTSNVTLVKPLSRDLAQVVTGHRCSPLQESGASNGALTATITYPPPPLAKFPISCPWWNTGTGQSDASALGGLARASTAHWT